MTALNILKCGNCNTENSVARCRKCGRGFVVTAEHLEGRLRDFDATPVVATNADAPGFCDFCTFESLGNGVIDKLNAGLRQKTCPSCHTEFLSEHGY